MIATNNPNKIGLDWRPTIADQFHRFGFGPTITTCFHSMKLTPYAGTRCRRDTPVVGSR